MYTHAYVHTYMKPDQQTQQKGFGKEATLDGSNNRIRQL